MKKKLPRASGILLPISSLPSRYGIGSLGDEAKQFAKKLNSANQRYWQVLPLNPVDTVNSPYASPSAFAGNVLLIDLEEMAQSGLIYKSDLKSYRKDYFKETDYCYATSVKNKLFTKAFQKFNKSKILHDQFKDFCKIQKSWLDDFALFMSLKNLFEGKVWNNWPDKDIVLRKKTAIEKYKKLLKIEIKYQKFLQFIFFKQLKVLRDYLKNLNIKLIGDIPFYVAFDSVDVWVNSSKFLLDGDMNPVKVAGVPPDFFSEEGQLWGNPLYNWDIMKKDNFRWWVNRFKAMSNMYDVIRIDHFRAFDSYYEIPYGELTAKNGLWKDGPGLDFFKQLKKSLPEINLIAEDLGEIGERVNKLRDDAGLPGMKVLQFAFDGNFNNPFLPHNFYDNCVAYTGTHDNDTVLGWWKSLPEYTQKYILKYCNYGNCKNISHKFIQTLLSSKANTVIIAAFDIAKNDSDRRINIPSVTGCWKYMLQKNEISAKNWSWLGELTRLYGRAEN